MGNNWSTRCDADPSILLPPPPPSSFPPPPGPGGDGFAPQKEFVNEKFKLNPGTLEELHKKCKEVFPQPFEGAKLLINKGLNQGFQVSHNLTLSSITPSGYRFGGTYVGTRMITPSDPATVLIADMDPSGNLNAQGVNQLTDRIKMKFGAQVINNKYQAHQATVDYKGNNYTASFALVNPNIFTESGIGIFHYLHGITPRIALGVELMHQRSMQIPGGAGTIISGSGRYISDTSVWSGFFGTNGMGLCYYRKMNDELQVSLEVENSLQSQQIIVTAGYQYDIPKANFTMKAMVDSNWTVAGVFEKKLLPMPFILSMSGSLNHLKNQFRIGCGFTIGG